jgi:hypothetical protein
MKHDTSIPQLSQTNHSYVYNLFYKNVKTSLNYFALAVIMGEFKIGFMIADEIF